MHTTWKPPVSLQYQENFTWTIRPLHLGQSQPQYYLSRQVWFFQCHYAVLLLFSPFWELMDSGFNMRFSATLVWAHSNGFCLLLLFSLSFIFAVSLNNPSGRKKITSWCPFISVCATLCSLMISADAKARFLQDFNQYVHTGSLSIIVRTHLHRSTQTTFLSSLIAIEHSTVGPRHFRRHHIYMFFYL